MERNVLLTRENLKISCKLSVPENRSIRRMVLGVHGFAGSADDAIQTGIAEEMGLFGAATVRFDFPAHGESPMGSAALSLQSCVDTLLGAAGYGLEQFPDTRELCVFATGFGAYVTLTALNDLLELPVKVKLVLQTPSVRMDKTLLAMLGRSAETLRLEERCTVPAPRPFDVTYRFYEELRQNGMPELPAIPVLILQGEKDDYIDPENLLAFRHGSEEAKLVIIPGASHRFQEEGAWDMVLDLTRDWFEFEQVLLSDWE